MSSKKPTIKRILKEASELASQPSAEYHAAPLETDLFEWHFTIRGPPAPSPFDGGVYHGRIVLPPAYPLKPPSFRFLTPTGRFETNREICLSISGHHEETWQPAWGIRTALVAIRSFMDTDAQGQLGGMDASADVRKRLAAQSRAFKCGTCCAKTNEEIVREQEEAVRALGGEGRSGDDVVPEELRLAYRGNLGQGGGQTSEAAAVAAAPEQRRREETQNTATQPTTTDTSPLTQAPPPTRLPAQARLRQAPRHETAGAPAWIDNAIYGVIAALALLVIKRLAS